VETETQGSTESGEVKGEGGAVKRGVKKIKRN